MENTHNRSDESDHPVLCTGVVMTVYAAPVLNSF